MNDPRFLARVLVVETTCGLDQQRLDEIAWGGPQLERRVVGSNLYCSLSNPWGI